MGKGSDQVWFAHAYGTSTSKKPTPPIAAPHIDWNHTDGPLLVCHNNTSHLLTSSEIIWVHFGWATAESLDTKYTGSHEPQYDPQFAAWLNNHYTDHT